MPFYTLTQPFCILFTVLGIVTILVDLMAAG